MGNKKSICDFTDFDITNSDNFEKQLNDIIKNGMIIVDKNFLEKLEYFIGKELMQMKVKKSNPMNKWFYYLKNNTSELLFDNIFSFCLYYIGDYIGTVCTKNIMLTYLYENTDISGATYREIKKKSKHIENVSCHILSSFKNLSADYILNVLFAGTIFSAYSVTKNYEKTYHNALVNMEKCYEIIKTMKDKKN